MTGEEKTQLANKVLCQMQEMFGLLSVGDLVVPVQEVAYFLSESLDVPGFALVCLKNGDEIYLDHDWFIKEESE